MTTPAPVVPGDMCSPWPVELCCSTEGVEQEVIDRWVRVASQILFRLSGRRWGPSCPITVRPCKRSCVESMIDRGWFSFGQSTGGWVPYIGADGAWRNASLCGCDKRCSCTELCEIRLDGPVYDVVSVQDGEDVLPAGSYRVDSANMLVRTDGSCWPECQDMNAPPGTAGTVAITYRLGLGLDAAAVAAVSELTCHLLKGCNPGGGCGCKANPNVTRVTRQGVMIEKADPTLIYAEGRTGLPLADLWLSTVNPFRLSQPSRVYSPDYRRPRTTTWP